jgi:large subunit ribosomal protein L49
MYPASARNRRRIISAPFNRANSDTSGVRPYSIETSRSRTDPRISGTPRSKSPESTLTGPSISSAPPLESSSTITSPSVSELAATPSSQSPLLTYHVSRTPTNNLPVYTDYKGHGTLKLTMVRKIAGDVHALRRELEKELGLDSKTCRVTQPAGHVVMKGNHKAKILQFLMAKGF